MLPIAPWVRAPAEIYPVELHDQDVSGPVSRSEQKVGRAGKLNEKCAEGDVKRLALLHPERGARQLRRQRRIVLLNQLANTENVLQRSQAHRHRLRPLGVVCRSQRRAARGVVAIERCRLMLGAQSVLGHHVDARASWRRLFRVVIRLLAASGTLATSMLPVSSSELGWRAIWLLRCFEGSRGTAPVRAKLADAHAGGRQQRQTNQHRDERAQHG